LVGRVDVGYLEEVRRKLPSLKHRRVVE
jgi:hypothetical protein